MTTTCGSSGRRAPPHPRSLKRLSMHRPYHWNRPCRPPGHSARSTVPPSTGAVDYRPNSDHQHGTGGGVTSVQRRDRAAVLLPVWGRRAGGASPLARTAHGGTWGRRTVALIALCVVLTLPLVAWSGQRSTLCRDALQRRQARRDKTPTTFRSEWPSSRTQQTGTAGYYPRSAHSLGPGHHSLSASPCPAGDRWGPRLVVCAAD